MWSAFSSIWASRGSVRIGWCPTRHSEVPSSPQQSRYSRHQSPCGQMMIWGRDFFLMWGLKSVNILLYVILISVDDKRANIGEIFHSLWIPPGQRKTAWPAGPRWSLRERGFELRSLSTRRQSRSQKGMPNVSTREMILLQMIHVSSNLWHSLISRRISRLIWQPVPPLTS